MAVTRCELYVHANVIYLHCGASSWGREKTNSTSVRLVSISSLKYKCSVDFVVKNLLWSLRLKLVYTRWPPHEVRVYEKIRATMKLFLISIHEAFKTVLKNIVDEAVATVVEPLINEIHQLQEEVGSLKSRLVKVEMIANENEQYSRKI